MAAVSIPYDPTLAAMNAAIERDGNSDAPRQYLGMSGIGKPCHRAIWYDFRWATDRQIAASGLRAIQDGYANEELTIKRLRAVDAITLWTEGEDGQQIGCEDLSGHFCGHLDGVIEGLLQAPKTPHVWENKAVNQKKFDALKKLIAEVGEKLALINWDSIYHAQAQLYMHYTKLTRHYLTVNTPGGRDTVACRTNYDKASAQHYIDLARSIIASEGPPMRMSDDAAHWKCKWCDHHAVCHTGQFPKVTCRSCAHVTPMLDELGGWHCQKYDDRIPVEVQRTGCEQHLYHPEILHFLQPVNGNMEQNWVQYQDKAGATVINGPEAHGGIPSVSLYFKSIKEVVGTPAPPVADEAPPVIDESVLCELSIDSTIPIQQLTRGDLSESDWPKVTSAVGCFYDRWKDQPAKLARMRALIEVIDDAYVALTDKVDQRRAQA